MKKALFSCKRATELIDQRQLEPLSRLDNLRLGIHTRMCSACRHYQKESEFLDAVLTRGLSGKKGGLSVEEKKDLIERIREHENRD